jgi:hypothetical protein
MSLPLPEWRHPEVLPHGASKDVREVGASRHLAAIRKQEARLAGPTAQLQWLQTNLKWVRFRYDSTFYEVQEVTTSYFHDRVLVILTCKGLPYSWTLARTFNRTSSYTHELVL